MTANFIIRCVFFVSIDIINQNELNELNEWMKCGVWEVQTVKKEKTICNLGHNSKGVGPKKKISCLIPWTWMNHNTHDYLVPVCLYVCIRSIQVSKIIYPKPFTGLIQIQMPKKKNFFFQRWNFFLSVPCSDYWLF